MKILDLGNAGPRLKVFLIWGILLFVAQFLAGFIFGTTNDAVIVATGLLFSLFAGYMAANSLKNKTGDKRSSAGYGAIIPIFATLIASVFFYFTQGNFEFNLPWLQVIAGLIGGFISQKRLL